METQNKLIICCGISGSGKSSWSTQYIKENPNTLRINRDSIRLTLVGSLDGYYQRKDLNKIEHIVNTTEEDLIYSFAGEKYDIIIDNTNLKQSYINRFLKHYIIERDYTVQFKLFDVSLEDAKERVKFRDNNHTNTYGDYIDKQYLQYKEIKQFLLTHYPDQIL